MDSGSPISLDFSFPFGAGSPRSNTGNDENTLSQSTSNQSMQDGTRFTNNSTTSGSRGFASQHRTSIDSMLEQDTAVNWSQNAAITQGQRHGSAVSFSTETAGGDLDKKQSEDDKLPSWSELKTKAGKERKRLPLACIACRRKKIKCSGEKPACKHCLRARVPCVYKVTTRKAAPRTDYMAMLDKRLKRMEDRVIKMIPKDDLPDLNTTGRASVRPPLPGQAKKEKATPNKRSAEEAFNTELSEWVSSRKPVNILGKAGRLKDRREAENKLFTEGADSLPPQHVQDHLAELFFDCVYGQSYLLLHKPSFMRKLKAGTVPPVLVLAVCAVSARFSTHPQVNTEPAFLRGEHWATPARKIAEKRHFEPNITILTVMLILGLHYFGTCEGGLSWSFGGQAMRMGYALQLHRELDHDPLGQAQAEKAVASGKPAPQIQELSFTDREIRRRLMWACYLMDTFNSSGADRPSFLNEDYMKIQLPIRESHFQLEMPGLTEDITGHIPLTSESSISAEQTQTEAKANMGVAAYAIRAVVIWKRIVQYLNLGGKDKDSHQIWDPLSQFASLQRQITSLVSNLPDGLRYTPENLATHVTNRLANQFLFLHIVIAQTSLFLHRFAIPTAPNVHRPYPPNTPKAFLASSAATVVEAASQVSRIISDSTGHTLTVPFAGYCAYASATVHVWGIFSRNAGLEASSKENLRHNYRYLTRMKRYWGMFHYMAESIKDIYRAFAEVTTRRLTSDQQKTTTTASGDTKAAIDSIAMSLDPSRSTTPTAGVEGQLSVEGESDSPSDSAKSPAARSKSASGKPMFQYGDWFDKYPHGVSETEWETSHLPHRKDMQRGHEAVMSQQSDLQSVEDFFASLSPPSKGENEAMIGQRNKKVAKKRGKSVADNALSTPSSTTSGPSKASEMQSQTQTQTQTQVQQQQRQAQGRVPTPTSIPTQKQPQAVRQQPHLLSNLSAVSPDFVHNTSDIDIPMSEFTSQQQQPLQSQGGNAFDFPPTSSNMSSNLFLDPMFNNMASPGQPPLPGQQRGSYAFSIDSPATASNAGSAIGGLQSQPQQQSNTSNPQVNFNFNYTSALPHLDRQMVYGAYAGIDPSASNSSSALNNPNNLEFWNNPWDNIELDAFTGYGDPYGVANTGAANIGSAVGSTSHNQNAATGSAWFMPFNIDPPDYGMDELTYSGLDVMDMGGNDSNGGGGGNGNQSGRDTGSFSGLNSPQT